MRKISSILFLAMLVLAGCGGGSTPDPITPPIPPIQKVGDFELIAGTLSMAGPAETPRCQSGAAIGANFGAVPDSRWPVNSWMAAGRNGHIYLLKRDCELDFSTLSLLDIDPSTGRMQVTQIPYDPHPEIIHGPVPGLSTYAAPSLTKVFEPVSMTIASDLSVLIGDGELPWNGFPYVVENDRSPPGYGRGIWRFKDGILSKLAGFDNPQPYDQQQDGKGGEAAFASLNTLCAGPNDAIYINDNLQTYRKVSLDGVVETIGQLGSGRPAFPPSTLICATNQRVFAQTTQDGKPVFGDLVSGRTFGPVNDDTPELRGALRYGFGDGFVITGTFTIYIGDTKTRVVTQPAWISHFNGNSSITSFNLDTMPYGMPDAAIVVDDNNMAYLYSGNALLRYKLPQ
jgi:hypothetical protein